MAALLASQQMLQQKHAVEEEEERLRKKKEQIELQTKIAASRAKINVYMAAAADQSISTSVNGLRDENGKRTPSGSLIMSSV